MEHINNDFTFAIIFEMAKRLDEVFVFAIHILIQEEDSNELY